MHKFSTSHRVYYYETDKMGRVYHSNYLNWMEEARTELIRNCGLSYSEMEKMGIFLPVSEIEIKYTAPVEYDEIVVINTTIEEISRIKVKFLYEFIRESDGVTVGKAVSVNIFADEDGKVKRAPKEIIENIRFMTGGEI